MGEGVLVRWREWRRMHMRHHASRANAWTLLRAKETRNRNMVSKESTEREGKERMSFREVAACLGPSREEGRRLRNYFGNLKGLYVELLRSHRSAKRRIVEMEKENCDLKARNATLREKVDLLSMLPEDIRQKSRQLELQAKEKEEECMRLNDQFKSLERICSKRSEEIVRLKTRLVDIEDEHGLQLALNRSQHDIERSRYESKIAELEGKLRSHLDQEERSKASIEQEDKKDALIQALRGKVFSLLTRIENQETRALRFENALREGTRKEQASKKELESDRESWNRRIRSYEIELEAYDASNKQLHEELASSQKRNRELTVRLEELQRSQEKDRISFEDRLLSLESDRKACRAELLDQLQAVTRTKERLESSQRRDVERLQLEHAKSQSRCAFLERCLTEASRHAEQIHRDATRSSQDRESRIRSLHELLSDALSVQTPSKTPFETSRASE